MAFEKNLLPIMQVFLADGGTDGTITVADTTGFFVKQSLVLRSSTLSSDEYEVKEVSGYTTLKVGLKASPLTAFSDISAYKASELATITAYSQKKPDLKPDEIVKAVYERDPVVAIRTYLVDQIGAPFKSVIDGQGVRRLPVDANLSVGDISVDISNPKTPRVNTVPTTTVQEYSFSFPANTKRFLIKTRQSSAFRLAFQPGDTSSNYLTVRAGVTYSSLDIDPVTPFTVYIYPEKPNEVIEIHSWIL